MFSRKHLSSYILNVGMIDLYIQLFCTIVPSTPLENLLYIYLCIAYFCTYFVVSPECSLYVLL